ncbi:serine/threonine protein kinase [Candidatus Symbiothrix dinenymphae]|nr:serine/threonine protein kinase [Candidatus Symbiothrix dinenymphae]
MSIKFRMAAWSDAAGRPNNEDCFVVSKNIAAQEWAFVTNETLALGEKGALMVVCDGMGGMNAGEVASAVAVETVKEWFAPEKLTDEVVKSTESILRYIKKTIIAADKKIKEKARLDPEKEGMGSTIVLAWLLDQQVYAGWCGDSRAYRYNPANGIERLSHDHSYVQELVDAGKLTPELAMEHPHSNIITRSLGDIRQEAQPDTKAFPLCTNDIILLCSDGLCGIMQDAEIEAVIAENTNDMGACRDALLQASEQTGWTDNVTFTLSQIVSGGDKAEKKPKKAAKKKRGGIVCLVVFVLLLLVGGYFGRHCCIQNTDENQENVPDSTHHEKPDSVEKEVGRQTQPQTEAIDTTNTGEDKTEVDKQPQTEDKNVTKKKQAKKVEKSSGVNNPQKGRITPVVNDDKDNKK